MRFLVSFFWGGGSVKQRGLSAQTRERGILRARLGNANQYSTPHCCSFYFQHCPLYGCRFFYAGTYMVLTFVFGLFVCTHGNRFFVSSFFPSFFFKKVLSSVEIRSWAVLRHPQRLYSRPSIYDVRTASLHVVLVP